MVASPPCIAMGTAIYRGLHTPSKRSSRASPPGLSKKCRKSPKGPEKESKRCQKLFQHFFDTPSLVALYRAMRLRCGYGFESCDANGPRNVKNTNIAKHRPIFLLPLLLVGSKELVLKVPKRRQFHAAIRVTRKRCDSCAQVAQGTRTVSRRNF